MLPSTVSCSAWARSWFWTTCAHALRIGLSLASSW